MVWIRTRKFVWTSRSLNLIEEYTPKFPKLQVSYDGHPVRNLTVSKVIFWNPNIAKIILPPAVEPKTSLLKDDPQWVGVLEKPLSLSSDNRFIGRYPYVAQQGEIDVHHIADLNANAFRHIDAADRILDHLILPDERRLSPSGDQVVINPTHQQIRDDEEAGDEKQAIQRGFSRGVLRAS